MGIHVRVMPNGRLSLPAALRRKYGLEDGGEVIISEGPHGLVLRTVAQAIAHAQALSDRLLEGKPSFSADDLIADRRREAALEE